MFRADAASADKYALVVVYLAWMRGNRSVTLGRQQIGLALAEIASLAYFQPHALPPGVPPGLEASGRYQRPPPPAAFSSG